MTADRRFERDLPEQLRGIYLQPMPDYRDDLLGRTAATPQRPAWTFPGRWLPMSVVTSRVATASPVRWRMVAVLALLIVAIAAATVLVVGSQQRKVPAPFGPAANGAVLYSWQGDIYARDTLTAEPRLLVGGETNDVAPSYSLDGTRFLFVRDLGGNRKEVWVARAHGERPGRIGGPYTDCCWFDWSPAGDVVAVAHTEDGVDVIDIVRSDGSGSTRVDVGFPAGFPTFRPADGSQLLFRGRQVDGKGWAFYLANADGSNPRRLALETGAGFGSDSDFLDPAWSPTGDRLAYSVIDQLPDAPGGRGERIHIATVSPDGTVVEEHRLTAEARVEAEFAPVWLPAGDGIVHRRFDGVGEEAWMAAASGGGTPKDLGVSAGSGLPLTISPDGSRVLALNTNDYTLSAIDLATGTVEKHFSANDAVSYQRLAP